MTIDPHHGTSAGLARYARRLDPRLIGLAPPRQIRTLAGRLGVALGRIDLRGGTRTFAHAVTVFLFNPNGREAAVFNRPFGARPLALALRQAPPDRPGGA